MMNRYPRRLELAAVVAAILTIPTSSAQTASDYTVHVPPATPAPAKGAWLTDPTFGSKILRVTAGSGISYRTQSSGWAWNADSTKFTIVDTGGAPHLFSWTGTAAVEAGTLPFASEAVFDKIDPNLVYGVGFRGRDEAVVRSYHLVTKRLVDVLGVRDVVPNVDEAGRTYLRGLATSTDRLAILFGGQSQDRDHYVYVAPLAKPKTGTLIDSVAKWNCHLHALAMDLSGRYLILGVRGEDIAPVGSPNIVWDVTANTFTKITGAKAGGHGTYGSGEYVNNADDEDAMEYRWRSLADVITTRNLVTPYPTPPAFYSDAHLSWVVPRHGVVSGTFRYGDGIKAPWRAWDDELIEIDIATGLVKRIAHHQSVVSAEVNGTIDQVYWSMPKPSVSPDGKVCIFTSDWRRTLGKNSEGPRQDVFLVKLE